MPELTAESLVSEDCRHGDRRGRRPLVHTCVFLQEAGDNNQFCWRNLFSCINLLRILNKLTKWKHSRTMVRGARGRGGTPAQRSSGSRFLFQMLVVFKSAPILKRALKVKQAMMQLYVLKLLKIQTKYLGRQWRKSNMKTMSAIYQKVRHRLNDDWAYGNGKRGGGVFAASPLT